MDGKPWKFRGMYSFVLENSFSGIESDVFRVLLDFRGTYRIAMTYYLLERKFCDVISLKVKQPLTLNFAGFMALSVLLLVVNFKSIQ